MNLEDLNLVELKAHEVEQVEGGMWPGLSWYTDVALSFGYYDFTDPFKGKVIYT